MTVETAKEYRQLAAKYRALGFNLVPLGADKRPVETGVSPSGSIMRFRWDDWQQTKQTDAHWAQIKKHEWWVSVGGLGGVCGPVSGDVVCIDFDATAPAMVSEFLGAAGLPVNYHWTVKTPGGGAHVWLRCEGLEIEKGKEDRPARDGGGHIELRWTGHYAALPGSVHPSGGVYAWAHGEPVGAPAPVDRDALLLAYAAVTKEPEVKSVTPVTHRNGTNGSAPHVPPQGYAQKALDEELQLIRTSAPHTHNNAVNKAAHSLGQLVGAGLLTEGEVEQALLSAALDVGQGEGEAIATIRSGLRSGIAKPRVVALNGSGENGFAPYEYGFAAVLPDPLDLEALPDSAEAAAVKHQTWPYAVKGGKMVLLYETRDGVESKPIADFCVTIAEEIVDENGNSHLVLAGRGLRRGAFRCEISGQDFGSDVRLLACLTAATGGIDVVYNGMSAHLRPAIGKLTTEADRPQRVRYYRTGWEDDSYTSFLMPGMDDSTLISVPRQIAYAAPKPGHELETGLLALTNLIDAMQPRLTTPIIASLLMPPMLRPAGLGNERVAIFIAGRTGSLKTSWTQAAMCLYGPGFASNDNLLKLGEGATRNAIMAFAAHAHDLPLLIDNYKPNTGNGKHDFVNLIHNILEGGDRKRSSRDGELRETKLVRCIPVVTGEDLPRDDAASIARILLVTFDWQRGEPNDLLTSAQDLSEHLCAVGWAWITWLQSDDGRSAAKAAGRTFPRLRSEWAARLSRIEKDSANIARVASNLAVNELAWRLACEHPTIGPALLSYSQEHAIGLRAIARTMAKSTVEAMEALQYRNALRELIGSGQYKLIDRSLGKPDNFERDRVLGWVDGSGVYLLPAIALAAVKRLLGPTQLLISPQTLYGQMQQLGWLATTGGDQTTRLVSIGGEKQRVLHLTPAILDANADGIDTMDESEAACAATGL
jgi:hypothetical protein